MKEARSKLRRLHLLPTGAQFRIYRRSIDARRRDAVKIVYSVAVCGEFSSPDTAFLEKNDISVLRSDRPSFTPKSSAPLNAAPIVVGTGPAGLFCALLLAENGYRPIVLERGGDIAERVSKIDAFKRSRLLDPETNIQFGAGGAGTFSDGKLVTRINDPLSLYVLERFVEFGAPEEILYLAKPHIGTDYLQIVVERMLDRIEALGGLVYFHNRLEQISLREGAVGSVMTTLGEMPAGALVLATGHSARDTYRMLMKSGLSVVPKPYSVGMRIEHLQEEIDAAMYGSFAGHPALGHAEYALSHNTKQRGVYTFCMCPGGQVVAAASTPDSVVVNGMSHHARDGKNANSAIVVSVFCEDYGNTPEGAIALQEKIEHDAFLAGGADYAAPLTTVGDLHSGEHRTHPTRVRPTYMDGEYYRLCSPHLFLPDFAANGIRDALPAFGRKIHGFDTPYAVLTGAETRTSAPVRILRDDARLAVGTHNVYPCGEGAGYAGGITSAAIDGIRTALSIMEKNGPSLN
ncbi:MAG: NAD(P)-binding protein [Clostridia bacterium]|nr:NAD(P)-binding protein [Clostridia bacterium]